MGEGQVSTVIRAMEKNENLVGKLYQVYAEKYPEWHVFWSIIAAEEEVHAQWLAGLAREIEQGTMVISVERFDLKAVQLFSQYLEQLLKEAQAPDLPVFKAMRCAYDIENALIEKKLFEIVSEKQSKYRMVVQRLQEATEIHRHKISEALASM